MSLLIVLGCGSDPAVTGRQGSDYRPVVIMSFRESGISPEIPWDISSGRNDVSSAALISTGAEGPDRWQILDESLERGLLVALVSDTVPASDLGPDNMMIWTSEGDSVITSPSELMLELPARMDLDSVKNHGLILQLCDTYKPDIVMMDLAARNPGNLMRLAEFWTSPRVLSRYLLVMYSLSVEADERGWCVIAGSGINGSTPYGLTESGLFSTVKLLCGLDWTGDLPASVPAISVLEDPDGIWRSDRMRDPR